MNDATAAAPVTYADVEAAAARLEGVAHRTPVATSSLFDAREVTSRWDTPCSRADRKSVV